MTAVLVWHDPKDSILRYALGLFCPIRIKPNDPTNSSINEIKVIYNDLLRLLCNSRRDNRKPTKEMLDQVGWLSLNQMSCEIRLIEVWKSLNIDNYCLKELFVKVGSNKTTRNVITLFFHLLFDFFGIIKRIFLILTPK